MSRTVGNVSNQVVVWAVGRTGKQFVEQIADRLDHFQVGLFIVSTHIINLTRSAFIEYEFDGTAMVFNIKPIANIGAFAINRQGFAIDGIVDYQRD